MANIKPETVRVFSENYAGWHVTSGRKTIEEKRGNKLVYDPATGAPKRVTKTWYEARAKDTDTHSVFATATGDSEEEAIEKLAVIVAKSGNPGRQDGLADRYVTLSSENEALKKKIEELQAAANPSAEPEPESDSEPEPEPKPEIEPEEN